MKAYSVTGEGFYADPAQVASAEATAFFRTYPPQNRIKWQDAMLELIARFDLGTKSVLSVGAGAAHEEHWFWRSGCRMTLVDIDEHGLIASYLNTLPHSGSAIDYVIGDAMELLQTSSEQYDVVYFSSFTPDESRRGDIQQRFLRRLDQRVRRFALRSMRTWPKHEPPVGPYVEVALERRLRPGGLFISQSYFSGVAIDVNPHYLDCMRGQLRSLGVELIAYYTFAPPWTGVSLAIGLKGSAEDARRFTASLAAKPQLTRFHGRSDLDTAVVAHPVSGA